MSGLRRFCLIVFAIAGALCLCVLALPWVGPYQREATALMDNPYYYIAMQALLAITALGVIVALLRALFTPRKRKTVVIDKSGGDQITVTTAAISSQTTHVIEGQDRFIAEKVRVNAGKRGVTVNVRVRPRHTVDLTAEGKRLHDDLSQGLATICGDRVRHVNLEFVEAAEPAPALDVTVERVEQLGGAEAAYEPAALGGAAPEPTDITVPMGPSASVGAHDEVASEPDEAEGEVA